MWTDQFVTNERPLMGTITFRFSRVLIVNPGSIAKNSATVEFLLRTSLEQTTDDEFGGVMYYTSRFVVYSCIYHFPVLSL